MRTGFIARSVAMAALLVSTTAAAHDAPSTVMAFTAPSTPDVAVSGAFDQPDSIAPFAFAQSNRFFTILWQDYGTDPWTKLYFYYLDHRPPADLLTGDLRAMATPIVSDSAAGVWLSCDCPPDDSSCTPTTRMSSCGTASVWDTRSVAPGAYWLIAVATNPPLESYQLADTPVIVTHDASISPAVAMVRPDGQSDGFDYRYLVQWLASGTGPLTFEISYGEHGSDVTQFLVSMSAPPNSSPVDAVSFTYDWHYKGVSEGYYDVRVKVTDGTGQSAWTVSPMPLHIRAQDFSPLMNSPAPSAVGCGILPQPHAEPSGVNLILGIIGLIIVRMSR